MDDCSKVLWRGSVDVVGWKERVLNNGELLCVTVWDALKSRQRTREYNMRTRTWGEEHLSVGGWR